SRPDSDARPRSDYPTANGRRSRSEGRCTLDRARQSTLLDSAQKMTWPTPTPEEQVQFLRNMQRLLAEGLFVASYKFALIHALADLAVLKGEDTGAPLDIETKDIAAKF